jgi:hypothetical protein
LDTTRYHFFGGAFCGCIWIALDTTFFVLFVDLFELRWIQLFVLFVDLFELRWIQLFCAFCGFI